MRPGPIPRPVSVPADGDTASTTIAAMVVWKVAGFTMIILPSGLRGIPGELQEAARIDGGGPLRRFRFATSPSMRRTLPLVLPGVVAVAPFASLASRTGFRAAPIFLWDNDPSALPVLIPALRAGMVGSVDRVPSRRA